jgi:hypothetical protein
VAERVSTVERFLPPELIGQLGEGFLCEGFVCAGEPHGTANVTFLKFGGIWHRLYFDFPVVFWRTQEEEPKPWEIADEGFVYPHTDVGREAGVLGQALTASEIRATHQRIQVLFCFQNGHQVILEDINDTASYCVS